MAKILVRGVEHYYDWVKTPSYNEAKPVMVFVHGWGGSSRYWQDLATGLSQDFDCLLYDLRGFGRSLARPSSLSNHPELKDQEPSYELEDYAHDLAALLDNLEIKRDRVYIHAHSMGASIGLLFVSHYPQRVAKAILTCSGVFEYDERAFAAFYRFGGSVVQFRPKWLKNIPFIDRAFMARFLHRPLDSSKRREFLEDFLVADKQAALGTIFSSVCKYQAEIIPQKFTDLRVPTILISGQYDKIIPKILAEQAVKLNPLIQLSVISQTGHFPMLEARDNYLEVVRNFVGKQDYSEQ